VTTSRTRNELYPEYFGRMDQEAAQANLRRFLSEGAKGFEKLKPDLQRDRVVADFSIASILPVLERLAGRVRVGEVEPPAAADPLVVDAGRAQGAYLEFLDEASESVAEVGAYYVGQAFVNGHEALQWGVGQKDAIEHNQPVVTGFRSDADLPVLVVTATLLRKSVLPGFPERLATAVFAWESGV
jgi:hypothetical protein